MQYLGYYSASLIFIPVAAWALGYRSRFVMAATTVCYLLFIFVVFDSFSTARSRRNFSSATKEERETSCPYTDLRPHAELQE